MMSLVTNFTKEQWQQYADKLDEYASGNTVGTLHDLRFGTCRYCEFSDRSLDLPAYAMFEALEDVTQIARDLSEHYAEGNHGRTPFRIRAAGELAEFIREYLVNAQ